MRPSAPGWLSEYVLIRPKTGSAAGLAEQFPAASLSALICVAMLTAVFAHTGLSAFLASQAILTYSIESTHNKPLQLTAGICSFMVLKEERSYPSVTIFYF